MNIAEQAELGKLISPRTGDRLFLDGEKKALRSQAGEQFQLADGKVPILLADREWAEKYSRSSAGMSTDYSLPPESYAIKPQKKKKQSPFYKKSEAATDAFFRGVGEKALCLSIGGGPHRQHERAFNLNIGLFPNVDVVADAHRLPYADNSVDYAYAKSVFEHLHSPHQAAAEIARVLRPGGRAFIDSPFLFVYHGYPHHYYNFTITGHRTLFEQHKLKTVDIGISAGPGAAMAQLMNHFIAEYTDGFSKWFFQRIWRLAVPMVRRVDWSEKHAERAHLLAGNTYIVLEKS